MKNYRFYAELPDGQNSKSGSKHVYAFTREYLQNIADTGICNNCVAVLLDDKGQPLWHTPGLSSTPSDSMDAISAVNGRSNAPVESCSVDRGYLRKRCVRIDETLARRLHPNLFAYLERP